MQSTKPALARSLSLLHATLYGLGVTIGAETMSLIAVMATLNGIIVQIIMASRVLYGLAH